MKKFLSLFVLLVSTNVLAEVPNIVATVNDHPITKYEFESRKNLIVTLNKMDLSEHGLEQKVNSEVLNMLIDEELLSQYAEKVGGKISEDEVIEAIASIEKRNDMSRGGMKEHLRQQGLSYDSFATQIKSELVRQNILGSLSGSVSVSPTEVNIATANSGDSNFDVEAWVFTSRGAEDSDLKQMQTLKKRLSGCNKVADKLYDPFADAEKFDRKLKKMPEATQSVVIDTKVGSSSNIYKENGRFKMVLVCKKEANVSEDNLDQIRNFLSNKKMSQKAMKFFRDLRSKAYIKIMMPGV